MDIFDPNEWPLSAAKVATLCDVDIRTAQRWIAGTHKPPSTAVKLIQLTQRNRIIPEEWPNYFKFDRDGTLDVGHKIRLTRYMLEHHAYSIRCWYALIDDLKKVERRMDELEKLLPRANVVELDNYRRRFNTMKSRTFSLSSGYESRLETNVIPFR